MEMVLLDYEIPMHDLMVLDFRLQSGLMWLAFESSFLSLGTDYYLFGANIIYALPICKTHQPFGVNGSILFVYNSSME